MTLKCPKCGKRLNKKSEYCMYCGCDIKKENMVTEDTSKCKNERNNIDIITANNSTSIKKSFLYNKKIMIYLLLLILVITSILLFSVFSKVIKYNEAMDYMSKNEYSNAIKIFEELGDYKDSEKKLKETKYNKIIYEIDNYMYDGTIDNDYRIKQKKEQENELQQLGDYKDSVIYLKNIQNNLANLYFENGDFEEAKKYYELIKESYDVESNLEYIDILSKFQGKWIGVNGNSTGMKIKGTKIKVYWFENGKVTSVVDFNIPLALVKKDRGNVIDIEFVGSIQKMEDTLVLDNSKLIWSNNNFNLEYEKGDFTEEMIEEPQIGMTADEVLHSTWGKPKKINKSTYSWGTKEQWVYYGNKYIYLENGIVTSIQE